MICFGALRGYGDLVLVVCGLMLICVDLFDAGVCCFDDGLPDCVSLWLVGGLLLLCL